MFGQAHHKPWWTKIQGGEIHQEHHNKPGDGTSVNQLVLAQPGFIAQTSGSLTRDRIWGYTIMVDHVADIVFRYPMENFTTEQTIQAKIAYEAYLNSYGHTVKGYRADNGRFADAAFRAAVSKANQEISFCGVGAHHQNGIVKNKIKTLSLACRTLLLHAKRHWPEAITTILWPFAFQEAIWRDNTMKIGNDGKTLLERLSGTTQRISMDNLHTWGCPVYVLDARLQSGKGGPPKWDPRSCLGIYVGIFQAHAQSVALVLNPRTGHVSPQFHVIFDDKFSTVPFLIKGEVPPNWEKLVRESSQQVHHETDVDTSQVFLDQQPPDEGDALSDETTSHEGEILPSNEGGTTLPLSSDCEGEKDTPFKMINLEKKWFMTFRKKAKGISKSGSKWMCNNRKNVWSVNYLLSSNTESSAINIWSTKDLLNKSHGLYGKSKYIF